MSVFIDISSSVLINAQLYTNVFLNNQNKSVNLNIPDIEINHKLVIERLYINEYECFVNTSRGNYILNNEDPRLHLVFYNQRWLAVNRENALPYMNSVVDRKQILNQEYTNCKFGEKMIQTNNYTENNGVFGNYYISDRLIVGAKNYFENNLGCLFVYKKDASNNYTIIEDMITITYDEILGEFQGRFGSHFELIELNGYHYLVVCADNRLKTNSKTSLFIYSYKKRANENTFYFNLEREILVPRLSVVQKLVVSDSELHLVFDKEIITYYLSGYIIDNSYNMIQVSSLYSTILDKDIQDVHVLENNLYIVDKQVNQNSNISDQKVSKYVLPQGRNNSLIWAGTEMTFSQDSLASPIKPINKLRVDSSKNFVFVSSSNLYFYDQASNYQSQFTDITLSNISDIELFQNNSNIIYILTTNSIHKLSNKTTLTTTSVSNVSQITADKINNRLYLGLPNSNGGIVNVVNDVSLNLIYEISNYKNNSNIRPKVFVSDDGEGVYIVDRRTKIISYLKRNNKNQFRISQTKIPDSSLLSQLRFQDTILDIKIDFVTNKLVMGVNPWNQNVSSIIICNYIDKFNLVAKSTGTTEAFGTSIDVENIDKMVLVSDPNVPATIIQGKAYATGANYIYSLESPNDVSKVLRSSSPIGLVSRFSNGFDEIFSIGKSSNDVYSVTWFSNIYLSQYRSIILEENIKDASFLLEGKLILTTKDSNNLFYKNTKVNSCFEILTKQDFTIPELTSVNANINILPLNKHFVFFYYFDQSDNGNVLLYDIRTMKLIKQWGDVLNTNIDISKEGSTLSYARQTANDTTYIICT
jgi:hypothetical protein